MPKDVALTSRPLSAAARHRSSSSKGMGRITSGQRAASAWARSMVRLATYSLAAPAFTSAVQTASAAPPAPSSSTVMPAGSMPRARRLSTNPDPSVLWPMARPCRMQTVFTAPQSRAEASSPSSSGTMASFSGMVTLNPAQAALASVRKAGNSTALTRRAS